MFKKFFFLFCLLVSIFEFISCEVGLGSSVDTEPPKVSITYPPAMSVICGKFTLAGTCSDDQGVKVISISVVDSEGKSISGYGINDIAPNKNGKTWSVDVNIPVSNVFPLEDGKYTFNVSAKDSSDRVSGTSSRAFEIDNTAPFFIISSPAVTDSSNATEYGSVFKISGKIADDHDVRAVCINIFDCKGNEISGSPSWKLSNVDTAGGTNLTVARYFSNTKDISEDNLLLHNRYTEIYGANTDGEKVFTCSIVLEDCSHSYLAPVYDDSEVVNTTSGNTTSTLWLNDDIYDELMGSKSAYQLEAGDLKKIWNGSLDNQEVLNILKNKVTETNSSKLAFSLNKNANPFYNVAGYIIDGVDFGTNKAAKQGKVTFQVQSGRDGTLLKPETFVLYLFGPFDSSSINKDFISQLYENPVGKYKSLHKDVDSQAEIIFVDKDYKKGSVSSFTQSVELPSAITKNENYIFVASGKDADGLDIETSDGVFYGFTGESAGFAPSIEVTSPSEDDIINLQTLSSLVITGSATSDESKIKEITYSVDVYNQLSVQNGSYEKVGTITGFGKATSGFFDVDKKVNFSCDLSKGTGWSSCKPISGQMFIYNISITVTDDSNLYTTRSQKLYVDCLLPEPIIQSVEVIADNSEVPNLINGIVNVVGKVTEKNLKKLKLSVSDGTTTINFPSDDSSLESSFEQKVDTSAFEDEKNLTLTLIATDEAGNEKSVESIYKIQQESDRPVISDTDSLKNSSTLGNAWDNVKNGVNLFGVKQNNNLSISVVDDDGISKVIISVYDKNGKLIGSESAVSKIEAALENKTDGSAENPKTYTTGNISYRLPATEGKYRIDVEAFDSEYDNGTDKTKPFRSVKKSYYIIVNENNLIMRLLGVNDDSDCVKASEDYDVKGTLTLTDTNQLSSINCYEMKEICSVCEKNIAACSCNPKKTSGKWIKTGNPISEYKTVLQPNETNSISVSIVDSKISWSDKILASYIGDGSSGNSEKHFYYEANDVYGNSSAVELICNVDGICPEVNILTTGFDVWKKNSTQKLEVVSCDNSTSFNSGVSKVYYYKNSPENSVEMTAEYLCDKYGNKSSSGLYRKYSTTIDGISDGDSNNIYFYATDVVGNSSSPLNVILKIDTICPNISSFAINESKKVFQNTKTITLSYSVLDETSKVKELVFSTDSSFKNSISISDFSSGSYSYSLSGIIDGTYNVYMKAIDNAGNESDIEKTEDFIVDTTAPKVKITSLSKNAIVNKTITLSGTVNDNNLEATSIPKIYFKKTNGSWVVCTVENPLFTGQEWSCTVDTFVNDINNTDTACEVEFRSAFTDLAGNETTSDYSDSVVLLNVNQLSDIPEIKFTNINVSGSSTSSKKITGVISDDDGDCKGLWKIDKTKYNSSHLPSLDDNNGWNKFKIENGTGIFSLEIDNNETEGSKEWVLYVIDSNGTKFNSKSDVKLNRPNISDSITSASQLETVSFNYDITAPVPTLYVAHSENGLLGTDLNSTYGPNDKIYLKVSVKESVGMKVANPVSVVFNENTYGATSDPIHENDIYTYSFNPINLSTAIPEGNNQISVVATDSADQNNKTVGTIIFDKTAPFVQIISPTTEISDAVTGASTIKGIVSDNYSSVSKMYYAFPMKGKEDSELEWKEVNVSTSWEIKFASGAEESSDSLLYYVNSKEIDESFTYVFEDSGTENIYKLPIYFKVTDSAGNTEIRKTYNSDVGEKPLYVLVDSEGGKPKAWITSPEPNTTTSGIVTIYGGASDDVSVSSVKVRYCFSDSENLPETPIWNDAVVSGTNSWKASIDTTSAKYVFVSCKAVDDENKSRDWTNENLIKIDSNSPVIKNLKVVQYKDSSLVSELEYSAGMYISNISCAENGSWYLIADVSDLTDSGAAGTVDSITFSAISSSTGNEIYLDENDVCEIKPNSPKYSLKVPLKTSDGLNGLSGQIYYKIRVSDGNSYSETTVKINVDSTAPSLYNTNNKESTNVSTSLRLKSNSTVIGNEESSSKVENSNNFFTFGDTVGEAGSGLEYIAVSFKRSNVIEDGDDTNRIYNPMRTNGYTGESIQKSVINNSKVSGSLYINSDNLPALYYSNVTRNSEDSVTLPTANTNIRKGGLVKIAGSYRKITEVNSTEVKFSPTVSTNFTEIEFIIAQIIDHQVTESVATDLTSFTNDDGDCMVESINQVGSSYVWNASVDSTNIPDGPITICVTAIDKAGNISYGSVATSVCNKRPRIAKVLLGTDLNGDGKYTFTSNEKIVTDISNDRTADKRAFGEFSYYSALDANGRSQSEVEINSGDFKVISGLLIIPEFVGGNNSLGYIINSSITDYGNKATGPVTKLTSKNSLSSDDSNLLNGGSFDINSHISDFGLINVDSTLINGDEDRKFGITFWDKTEETVQGTDSQWAFLKIPVKLKTNDNTKPSYALINPFYWNSETDNSVYQGVEKGIKGHIELESDLSDSVKTDFGSDDPKISGQVILRGCVYDDVRLANIDLSFTGILDTKTTVLTYSQGIWTSNADGTKIISAKGIDEYVSQDGHKMNFEVVVDTEKISNFAGVDKEIRVYATDWKSNTFEYTGSTQSSNINGLESRTAYYKVDVVPYVTSITTELSEYYRSSPSVYARTAHGHYPVRESEGFTINGYNLGSSPTVKLNGISLTSSKENNIGTSASSGKLEVKVNSVACLNNTNNNEVEYNKQPNKVNNNILTDDISMDVWQFKNAATPKNGAAEHVTMKINPSTGIPGFSYANSILYFNMPAYKSNQGDDNWGGTDGVGDGPYSQIPVGMNYGGFSHNTFAFDKNGDSYGAAMCTDTQSAFASAYFQFFSRECPIRPDAMDQNMNYCNSTNASRLDSSSVKVYSSNSDSSWVTNINRIQSPAMETSVNGLTYVYLAYYDDATKQIRFRWGTVGTDPHDIDGDRSTSSASDPTNRTNYAFGLDDVVDGKYTAYAQGKKDDGVCRPSKVADSYYKYSNTNNNNIPIQIIASSGVTGGRSAYATATTYKAGNYVSLSIVNKDTSSPVAVVSWYDSSNRQLCMAYNTNPTYSNSWTTKVIDTEAGLNVKTAVDADGGIHFAYYKSTGSDLKYAYLSSYSSNDVKVCTVDSFGAVGAKCTIDVVKVDSNYVPYIGYQNNGYSGTPAAAKIAYKTDFTSSDENGSDDKDFITGAWEISVVPTNNIPKDDQVNIGLYKDSDGSIKKFNSGTNKWNNVSSVPFNNNTSAVGDATIVYANGTSNPVMAYGIDSGCIEMAQMK